ncbi:Uncharacterized protein FWK35_00029918 [Aphis craccivora]|uniref:Uncharacterized protein n=1 Tax=Aphis craccivora TaxID=307492 RepID=A0A6G0YVI1_APHCR|nr:Uncharacterized protein FWK35_00029918 [Aphis craccivora]
MDDGAVGGCERRRSYVANVCRRLLGRRGDGGYILCARETTGARVRMWYVCGRRRDGHGPFGANSTATVGHSSSTAAAAVASRDRLHAGHRVQRRRRPIRTRPQLVESSPPRQSPRRSLD